MTLFFLSLGLIFEKIHSWDFVTNLDIMAERMSLWAVVLLQNKIAFMSSACTHVSLYDIILMGSWQTEVCI